MVEVYVRPITIVDQRPCSAGTASSIPADSGNVMMKLSEDKGPISMISSPGTAVNVGLVLFCMSLSGCGGGDEPGSAGPGSGGQGPAATIIVDGSSTVFRISKAAQEAFASVNPDVTVVVDNHGTGGGFSRYLQGEVDIVDASRAAKPDEEAKAKAQGLDWTRFVVGYDGITLVVHPENDFVKSLTVA